jgi:hypothetical protein
MDRKARRRTGQFLTAFVGSGAPAARDSNARSKIDLREKSKVGDLKKVKN